jgi:hypothetical protein
MLEDFKIGLQILYRLLLDESLQNCCYISSFHITLHYQCESNDYII